MRAEREAGDEGTEQTRDAEPSPGPVRVDAHGGGRVRGGPGKHHFDPRALREGLVRGVASRATIGHHAFMMPALRSDAVTKVLRRLRAAGEAEDGPAKLRVRTRESELGQKIYGRERADLYGRAPIAITEEVGELLYMLALWRRARTIVEFGASLGVSTIYLAAAVRDAGSGRVITTELEPEKARLASANLAEAGLADLVDLRVGDALETLRDLAGPVDLLFLDGWNDLYLPVLELVAPHLAPGALVAADMSKDDPHHVLYREYVRDPARRYFTIELPLDDGVVLSVRLA